MNCNTHKKINKTRGLFLSAGLILVLIGFLSSSNRVQDVQAIQGCPENPDHYGQCGGTCNGQTFDSQEEVDVVKTVDSSCTAHWTCQSKGKTAACGYNPEPTPTPAPQPTPVPQERSVNTCKGEMTISFLRSQLQGANYNGPWDEGNMVAAFNRAACPVAQPTATPAPQPTPVPQQPTPYPVYPTPQPTVEHEVVQTVTQTANPVVYAYGGNANASTGAVTVTVGQGTTASRVVETRVAGVQALPKTGLPVAAWAFSGLLPLGLKARRFGTNGKILEDNPNFIWQTREFSK